MKVIFLDIDGVLNSVESFKENRIKGIFDDVPHPIHIEHLNEIIKATGAKVVISSVWRKSASSLHLLRLLSVLGFRGDILGSTPITNDYRGNEIQAWINRFQNNKDWINQNKKKKKLESFVIIDDDSDMEHLKPFLVKTNGEKGLERKHIKKAIKILNKGK